jgi:hypothetical protein
MTEHDDRIAPPAAAALPADAPMFSHAAWMRILPFAAYLFFIVAGDVLERVGVSAGLRWLYPGKDRGRRAAAGAVLAPLCRTQTFPPDHCAGADRAGHRRAGADPLGQPRRRLDDHRFPLRFRPAQPGPIDWLLVAIRIAGAALVVPVMEELFWRSFLMRWIAAPDFESVEPSQLGFKSFVITVLLFGVEHNLWLAGIVAGAAYSLLYMRHRTLWSPILAHAVTNGLLGIWVVRPAAGRTGNPSSAFNFKKTNNHVEFPRASPCLADPLRMLRHPGQRPAPTMRCTSMAAWATATTTTCCAFPTACRPSTTRGRFLDTPKAD